MKQLLFAFFLLSTLSSLAQDCSSIRNGVFYSYPKNTTDQYLIKRQDDIETDIDLKKGDSTVWKVDWKKDCMFTEEYVSGNGLTDEQAKFFKKHKLVFKADVNDNYYTYTVFLDKASGVFITTDTTWTHPKTNFSNNITYQNISKTGIDSLGFSDTSGYALLYIYRPNNFIGSLLNFEVFINGEAACIVKNNAAFAFVIRKEGLLDLATSVVSNKRTDTLSLDIKFGRKYFVRDVAGPVVVAFDHDMRPVFRVEADSTIALPEIENIFANKK